MRGWGAGVWARVGESALVAGSKRLVSVRARVSKGYGYG